MSDAASDGDPARMMAEMDEAEAKSAAADAKVDGSETASEFKAPPLPEQVPPAKVVVVSEDEPLTEDEIIRRKLMFDGDSGGDDRRLNVLMKSFFSWYRYEAGSVEKDLLYNKILYLLDDAESSMKKALLVQQMNEKEMAKYEQVTKELDDRIDESKNEIFRVKEDLEKAKNVRRNRMEYDPIVAKIKELPTRKQSTERIERMKGLANTLQERIGDLDRRLELRRSQVQNLSQIAQELHSGLIQDEVIALEDIPDDLTSELMGPAEPPVTGSMSKKLKSESTQ